MKLLALNGSPRADGNTFRYLTMILERAKSLGAETELVQLADIGRLAHQAFQRAGGLGVKRGQRLDGGDLLRAFCAGGAEHHVAHGDGAVVRRAAEIDGVALQGGMLAAVGLQRGVDGRNLGDGHQGHPQQNRQHQAKAQVQALAHRHGTEKSHF